MLTAKQNIANREHYVHELAKMRGDAAQQTADELDLLQNYAALFGISEKVIARMHGVFRYIKPIRNEEK